MSQFRQPESCFYGVCLRQTLEVVSQEAHGSPATRACAMIKYTGCLEAVVVVRTLNVVGEVPTRHLEYTNGTIFKTPAFF